MIRSTLVSFDHTMVLWSALVIPKCFGHTEAPVLSVHGDKVCQVLTTFVCNSVEQNLQQLIITHK